MNKELEARTKEWMQLERKTLAQRKKADEYYDSQLMTLIENDFIKRNKNSVFEAVEYLIVSVGTSYEPIVLGIKLFCPKKILFLYTEKSCDTLDKVIEHTRIKSSVYEKRMVSDISPIDIYKEIKAAYIMWNKPDHLYIDFTGGTKAMSAAAALAGAMVDVQMVYVASDDYLVDFRKPRPGSERIVYLENPISVFGDMEIEKAEELYSEKNFAGAKEILAELREKLPDPMIRQEISFMYHLSSAYEAWDALDFIAAYSEMEELVNELKRDGRNFPGSPFVISGMAIMKQLEALSKLKEIPRLSREKKSREILTNADLIFPLMFSMYMNAITREEQNKYDMATLLMYRLLEMIEQRRLAVHNLFVSDMNYHSFAYDSEILPELDNISCEERTEWLRRAVFEIRKELFTGRVSEYLPNPVSLLDGFIILAALQDSMITDGAISGINMLKQIRSKVYLRNNSIFAHGLGPVGKDDYLKFKSFVADLFKTLCNIECINFNENELTFSWLCLDDSAEE